MSICERIEREWTRELYTPESSAISTIPSAPESSAIRSYSDRSPIIICNYSDGSPRSDFCEYGRLRAYITRSNNLLGVWCRRSFPFLLREYSQAVRETCILWQKNSESRKRNSCPALGVRPKYRKKSSFLVIYLHYGTEAVRNGQDTNNAKHFSDEIVEDEFAYFIVENYEQSCEKVKEVLKRRDL